MGYSTISILFNQDLILNNQIGFSFSTPLNSVLLKSVTERWVNIRTGARQTEIGTPTAIAGERSAINFVEAFTLDFVGNGVFTVSRTNNLVLITANYPGYDFSLPFAANDYSEFPMTLLENIIFNINNFSGTVFDVDSVVFSEATTNPKCTHYKVSIQTSILTDSVSGNISVPTGNNNNPIVFEILRGQGFNLTLLEASGQTKKVIYNNSSVPSLLSNAAFNLTINNSPSGATVVINPSDIKNLNLEYSLDNSDWITENVFSSLFTGDYTLYIRDNFGCSTSLNFSINDDNIYTPNSYYSKSNSIIMVEQNESSYKTEHNTLSNQSFAINPRLAYSDYHLFYPSHVIPCQLWSNYSNIIAKVIKEDGTQDNLLINKITYNIGRKDARDAIKFNAGFGKTGLYFNAGKTYNYDTDDYEGIDYSLLGGLPEWAVIGNYFSIGSSYYQIENIYFDETLNVEVLIIDELYIGSATTVITKAIFNRQEYDVFEWGIDMSNYTNQTIQIQTTESDSRFQTIIRISEKILIKDNHKEVVEIVSYNTKNTDIFYASGIKHYALVHVAKQEAEHDDPSEVNKGDDASALVNSKLYESVQYEFDLLSLGGYRQLTRMLSNNMVFIDGVQCIKNGSLEKEGPKEHSNIYSLKASMLYANGGLNSNSNEIVLITDNENIDVPNLKITDAGSFISYQ